jgi:hypothetical protein
MRSYALITSTLLFTLATACSEAPTDPNQLAVRPSFAVAESENVPEVSPLLVQLNEQLASRGSNMRVLQAEYVTDGSQGGQESGHTIIANDRHWRLSSNWVAGDPNRGGRTNLTYVVDQSEGSALSLLPNGTVGVLPNSVTEAAIDRTFVTWDSGTQCSNLPIQKVADTGVDPDIIDALILTPAGQDPTLSPLYGTTLADITEAGWLPRALFDAIRPNGSAGILGVTFTLIWVDNETGEPTDMDRNGRNDVALKEIYYNRRVPWGDDLRPVNVDIESIVLHENGHALDLGHFGKVTLKKDGSFQFSPRAVMNAVYIFPERALRGTDNGHHCAQFGSWPN